MFTSITAFFTAMAEGFKSLTCSKERQSETLVIKRTNKTQKALDTAEKIIFMADSTELKESKQYQRLRKTFFKNN